MFRKLAVILSLVLIASACARHGELTDAGAIVQAIQAAHEKVQASEDGPSVRAAQAMAVATVVADSVILTSPGQLPKKAKLTASQSNFRLAGRSNAEEGVIAGVFSAGPSDLGGILRAPEARDFNKFSVKIAGQTYQGQASDELFGGYVCGTAAAGKKLKAHFKLKGTKNAEANTVAIWVLARVPLGPLGISGAQFIQTCENATSLLPTLRAIAELQTGVDLSR